MIKEFIEKKGITLKGYNELQSEKEERIRQYNENMRSLEESQLRRWL